MISPICAKTVNLSSLVYHQAMQAQPRAAEQKKEPSKGSSQITLGNVRKAEPHSREEEEEEEKEARVTESSDDDDAEFSSSSDLIEEDNSPQLIGGNRRTLSSEIVASNQSKEIPLTRTALSSQERHLWDDPCDSILRGDKTVEESLGWIFKVSHLKNLKALNVPQRASGDAISGESVREADSAMAAAAIAAENAYIEPRFINSRRLQNSPLEPVKRHRQNRQSVFETDQKDSGLWRAMIETTVPTGLSYAWQSWVQWKTLTGPSAIQQRLKSLEVFGQQPDSRAPPLIPRNAAEKLSSYDRRRTNREEVFARLRKVWSSQFCKLVGVWHNQLVALRHCTLQNLVANEATLEQLFANTRPSGGTKDIGLTITDFIILFDFDGLLARNPEESEETETSSATHPAGSGKNNPALKWLYDLKYTLDLHFTYKARFSVGVLTRDPFNIRWANFVRPKLALKGDPYGRLHLLPGFFRPDDMEKLGFRFARECKKHQDEFSYDVFRLMAHKGGWKYEDLFLCLDFTWDVIKNKLELTKSDLSCMLGWTKDPDQRMLTTKETEPRLREPAHRGNHWISMQEYSQLSDETIPMPKYKKDKKVKKESGQTKKKMSQKSSKK